MTSHPDGLDPVAVQRWLSERAGPVVPPLSFAEADGGRSNLTYVIEDARGHRWVLRRPPLHSGLPTAHDMHREHTVMSALASTPVPVPKTLGYEDSSGVTGEPFFVMGYVDGAVIRTVQEAEGLSLEERRTASESLVDVLVALHEVDPGAVGLADFGSHAPYISRQLRRWHTQLHAGGGTAVELLDEIHDRLAADIPEQSAVTLVHGDYRLDNVIVGPDGQVRAVLDWELSTLGDPLADLALLAVYWSEPGEELLPFISTPTHLEGFLGRSDVIARYSQAARRDVSALGFHMAFAYWKLAIVLAGVHARFSRGAYGSRMWEGAQALPRTIRRLAERAAAMTLQTGR